MVTLAFAHFCCRCDVCECSGQMSDDVMIVCQLSANVTKDDLHEMFPDALDIVLPRNRIASYATEKFNAKG